MFVASPARPSADRRTPSRTGGTQRGTAVETAGKTPVHLLTIVKAWGVEDGPEDPLWVGSLRTRKEKTVERATLKPSLRDVFTALRPVAAPGGSGDLDRDQAPREGRVEGEEILQVSVGPSGLWLDRHGHHTRR